MSAATFVAVFALVACTSSAGQSGSPIASTGASASTSASASPASGLEGRLWGLLEYLGPDGVAVTVPKALTATATFAAGTVSGNAGCNDYTGSYTLDGAKLTIGPLATTKKGCGPAQTALETAYLATFAKVASYTANTRTLQLMTADGKVGLRYVVIEATTLTKTNWLATSLNNGKGGVTSVIADTALTATFGTDGTVAGTGGCNTYSGPFTSDATTIKIGPLAATRKLCNTPAGVDEQEAQFLTAMQAATTYTIAGTTLELRDAGGALQVAFRSVLVSN